MRGLVKKLWLCCSQTILSLSIHELAAYIKKKLIFWLHLCDAYSLQLDESSDTAGFSVFLVFLCYDFDNSVENDLFYVNFLQTNMTGENIFNWWWWCGG
jgi:hypothetical protein